jgi:Putative porin
MRREALVAAPFALVALASVSAAQDPAPVYLNQPKQAFRFAGDGLARYEWTKDIPAGDTFEDESRYRLQLRPRVEATFGPVELGVGGDFNYSKDENDKPPAGLAAPVLIRDNYRSRDARLDLAWGKLSAGPLSAQGGRFFMPLPLTEMIWDRDLRPQGGAATINFAPKSSLNRFAITGLYAKGSHVFEDESVMFGGGLDLSFASGQAARLQIAGTYLEFRDLDTLDPAIRRQNTRVAGLIVNDYRVVDIVGRITRTGQLPLQLVGDYCWNTAVDQDNKGLWLAVVLGALGTSRTRLEYTYAKIDKDATVAAFNTDDFFWGTGWEGHRADLATSGAKQSSIHAIAQWQRFKDSPDLAQRDRWVKRFRLEWRISF